MAKAPRGKKTTQTHKQKPKNNTKTNQKNSLRFSSSNQMLLKVAQFAAQTEKYDKAIEIYETVAKKSIDNSLLKWSVKEYFLKAGLCHLCNEVSKNEHPNLFSLPLLLSFFSQFLISVVCRISFPPNELSISTEKSTSLSPPRGNTNSY
jgi:hypothetical protein